MKVAQLPIDEKDRLEVLLKYNILDTLAQVEFDTLTSLASYICQTPIALISFVDEHRQWFKSKIGLDATETSRDLAFCSHAILQNEVFIVNDALQDERFQDNPLVVGGPCVRFYAGAPLITPSKQRVGTLCVIDHVPRQLTPEQTLALQSLAMYVVNQMELKLTIDSLENAVESSKNSVKKQEIFLANISHEIRTPMNGILGFIELLKDTSLTEKQTRYVSIINKSANSLLDLINDILDFSKIESGMLKLHEDVKSAVVLLNEINDIYINQANEKNLNLTFLHQIKSDDLFIFDSLRVRQVISNLISNAIKFTEKGSVCVETTYEADKEQLIFKITDTGIGISLAEIHHIFDPFEQANNRISHNYGGTGLGLAIVKRLIALLKGEITCSSELGKGSVFTCSIRAKRAAFLEDKNTKADNLTPPQYTDLKVLVVEDMRTNQEIMMHLLSKFGITPDIANDGLEAIDKICKSEAEFDLVLMDIRMKNMDGYEATIAIRNNKKIKQPIIYALTAHSFEEDKNKSSGCGMDGHITKPCDQKQMNSILEIVHNNKRA